MFLFKNNPNLSKLNHATNLTISPHVKSLGQDLMQVFQIESYNYAKWPSFPGRFRRCIIFDNGAHEFSTESKCPTRLFVFGGCSIGMAWRFALVSRHRTRCSRFRQKVAAHQLQNLVDALASTKLIFQTSSVWVISLVFSTSNCLFILNIFPSLIKSKIFRRGFIFSKSK